jgi:epoxyqueuosine reductase
MPDTAPTLKNHIRAWGRALGFQEIGIAGVELSDAEARLMEWLAHGYHGEMKYFERHGATRARPPELVPGTLRVISARMNYQPQNAMDAGELLNRPERAYISRYALGRDYHKVLRDRLQRLCDRIASEVGTFNYRVFTDSAPVMEVELAAQAALGWRGKHSLLLNREAGSWFFLGEIYTDLPLAPDAPTEEHCGTCERCIDICPTQAIVAPYIVDARRCISYLTIEHPGSIPEPLRPMMGNRIYGCDDCQLVCPWNKFAQSTLEPDFAVRHGLDDVGLAELFAWNEQQFLSRMQGSAIRRIGYERWSRNIAVALGNAPTIAEVVSALEARASDPSEVVREHVGWALGKHGLGET